MPPFLNNTGAYTMLLEHSGPVLDADIWPGSKLVRQGCNGPCANLIRDRDGIEIRSSGTVERV